MSDKDKLKGSLAFDKYIVNEIEFRTNPNYKNKESETIDFDLTKDVSYNKDTNIGSVVIKTTIFDNAEEMNYPFYIKVVVTGTFEVIFDNQTDSNEREAFSEYLLNNNAVAILFPYIRALISTYTANANVPPLILPPINVSNL